MKSVFAEPFITVSAVSLTTYTLPPLAEVARLRRAAGKLRRVAVAEAKADRLRADPVADIARGQVLPVFKNEQQQNRREQNRRDFIDLFEMRGGGTA